MGSTTETETRPTAPPSGSFGNLDLLLEWPQTERRWKGIMAASLAMHSAFFLAAIQLPSFVTHSAPQRAVRTRVTALYLPPDLLTQRAPNRNQPTKSIDLASLMASRQVQAQTPRPDSSTRHFEMPKNLGPLQTRNKAPQITAEAPNVALNQPNAPLPAGAASGLPAAPPPPTPVAQPFQNVGTETHQTQPHPKIAVPKASVQSAVQSLSQQGNGSHLIVTDDSLSQPAPGAFGSKAEPGTQHAQVELQSDPEGADFRAYLAHILSIVRTNWRRVLPESARMGTLRGSTVIDFVISRDGSIPKLVEAEPSGSEALDRAAVAGLSMSNPLPPLPADYKGFQVRLAFTFSVDAKPQ